MPSRRQTQVSQEIAQHAADFFARESNRASLMTITRADISPDLKNVTLFISVLPTEQEGSALHFAKRMRPELKQYLKDKSRLRVIPGIEVELDYGEKNRQRVDDVLARS